MPEAGTILFTVSEERHGKGWCIGDRFDEVGVMKDGTLYRSVSIVRPGGWMQPNFDTQTWNISKSEYLSLLKTSKEKGFLDNAGEERLKELEELGRE